MRGFRWWLEELLLDCRDLVVIGAKALLRALPYLGAAYCAFMAWSFLALFCLLLLGGCASRRERGMQHYYESACLWAEAEPQAHEVGYWRQLCEISKSDLERGNER